MSGSLKALLVGGLEDLYERDAPPETPDWHYDEVAACFREGRVTSARRRRWRIQRRQRPKGRNGGEQSRC
jgi:hypothetical protein